MANPYFQFKEFRIEQDKCGMKVCTDSCIMGAYTSMPGAHRMLDIGSGTGLLSLMLAQRHPQALLDGVEIEENAFQQAGLNVQESPWAARVRLYHSPIQEFSPEYKYDLIICNPPFYPGHLLSASPQRRQAFHQQSLRFEDLIEAILRLLNPTGLFSLLLPARQAEDFSTLAQKAGLFMQQELQFFENKSSRQYRSISVYGFLPKTKPLTEKLIIRADGGSYSQEFQQLLKPYYTIF